MSPNEPVLKWSENEETFAHSLFYDILAPFSYPTHIPEFWEVSKNLTDSEEFFLFKLFWEWIF